MAAKMKYTVPDYMAALVKKADNPYQLFNRFLDNRPPQTRWKNGEQISVKNANHCKIAEPAQLFTAFQKANQLGKKAAQMDACVKELTGRYDFNKMEAKLSWHMIVGLGATSVSRTSMTLEPVTGVPYIPGQALKGVTRSFIINEYFRLPGDKLKSEKAKDSAERRAMADPLFAFVFGSDSEGDGEDMARSGHVCFYDAYPYQDTQFELVEDIMNNHHQNYYDGGELNDRESPNPVKIWALKGVNFPIWIGIPKRTWPEKAPESGNDAFGAFFQGESVLDGVAGIMKDALKYQGVGAKTAVGYGSFDVESKG